MIQHSRFHSLHAGVCMKIYVYIKDMHKYICKYLYMYIYIYISVACVDMSTCKFLESRHFFRCLHLGWIRGRTTNAGCLLEEVWAWVAFQRGGCVSYELRTSTWSPSPSETGVPKTLLQQQRCACQWSCRTSCCISWQGLGQTIYCM